MKFKVVLWNTGDGTKVDTAGNFEFYTLDEATNFCSLWVELSNEYRAYLWNGSSWTYIYP